MEELTVAYLNTYWWGVCYGPQVKMCGICCGYLEVYCESLQGVFNQEV